MRANGAHVWEVWCGGRYVGLASNRTGALLMWRQARAGHTTAPVTPTK